MNHHDQWEHNIAGAGPMRAKAGYVPGLVVWLWQQVGPTEREESEVRSLLSLVPPLTARSLVVTCRAENTEGYSELVNRISLSCKSSHQREDFSFSQPCIDGIWDQQYNADVNSSSFIKDSFYFPAFKAAISNGLIISKTPSLYNYLFIKLYIKLTMPRKKNPKFLRNWQNVYTTVQNQCCFI